MIAVWKYISAPQFSFKVVLTISNISPYCTHFKISFPINFSSSVHDLGTNITFFLTYRFLWTFFPLCYIIFFVNRLLEDGLIMKKIFSFIGLFLALAILFSSCDLPSGKVITVGSVEVDKEIYTYYLDSAVASSEGAPESTAVMKEAAENCVRYITVNTIFSEMGLSLTDSKKNNVSQTVNDLWRLYGNYYEKIGVSKQTLTKVYESKAYENAIFLAYYDTDGITPIPEETVKKYFSENYAIIKSINGYLTDLDENGNTVPMDAQSRQKTTTAFTTLVEKINSGTLIDDVYSDYISQEGSTVQPVVISKDSSLYPEGFFDSVKAIEDNKAAVIVLGDYIFAVQRLASDSDSNLYYQLNRENCLLNIKGEEFEELMSKWTGQYSFEVNQRAAKACYKKITANSSAFNTFENENLSETATQ